MDHICSGKFNELYNTSNDKAWANKNQLLQQISNILKEPKNGFGNLNALLNELKKENSVNYEDAKAMFYQTLNFLMKDTKYSTITLASQLDQQQFKNIVDNLSFFKSTIPLEAHLTKELFENVKICMETTETGIRNKIFNYINGYETLLQKYDFNEADNYFQTLITIRQLLGEFFPNSLDEKYNEIMTSNNSSYLDDLVKKYSGGKIKVKANSSTCNKLKNEKEEKMKELTKIENEIKIFEESQHKEYLMESPKEFPKESPKESLNLLAKIGSAVLGSMMGSTSDTPPNKPPPPTPTPSTPTPSTPTPSTPTPATRPTPTSPSSVGFSSSLVNLVLMLLASSMILSM